MNNYNHFRKRTTSDEVAGETQSQFLSVAVCCQPLKRSVAVCHQPLRQLKRSCNISEIKEELNCTPTWINGFIPNSLNEFRRSRTSFEVSDINSTTIANRIFDSNKNRSICAVYDGAIMKCKTPSHVIFTVRLVRISQEANIALVEVRRRRGCPILFRDEYQALFQAAVHGEISPCEIPRSRTFLGDIDYNQVDYIPLEEAHIERSLQVSSVDIESKMYDSRVVALQDLSLTTDPLSKETSATACRLILEKYCNIFEYIVDDITKQVDYSGSNTDSEEYLRSLTLNLLGNILMVVPKHSTLISLIQDRQQIISITKSLLWYVRMARECPSNASLAAKCLRLFVQTDAMLMLDVETNVILENGKMVGQLTYPNLEREAQATLTAIKV